MNKKNIIAVIVILAIAAIAFFALTGKKKTAKTAKSKSQNAKTEKTTPAKTVSAITIPKADVADYNITIDPANFVSAIDNKYFSLKPGTVLTYQGKKDNEDQKNVVTVTNDTKEILGVKCVVANDQVYTKGALTEETIDWYAQDKNGNVWYFGEASKDYENGKLTSTAGSWETGKDGALPGVIMTANPQVGDSWKQEYLKGVAEDRAEIIGVDESIKTSYGSYQRCVKTKDWSAIETGVMEEKYYCDGNVVSINMVQGGSEFSELVSVK